MTDGINDNREERRQPEECGDWPNVPTAEMIQQGRRVAEARGRPLTGALADRLDLTENARASLEALLAQERERASMLELAVSDLQDRLAAQELVSQRRLQVIARQRQEKAEALAARDEAHKAAIGSAVAQWKQRAEAAERLDAVGAIAERDEALKRAEEAERAASAEAGRLFSLLKVACLAIGCRPEESLGDAIQRVKDEPVQVRLALENCQRDRQAAAEHFSRELAGERSVSQILMSRAELAEADCAAMRAALEDARELWGVEVVDPRPFQLKLEKALALDAGRGWLSPETQRQRNVELLEALDKVCFRGERDEHAGRVPRYVVTLADVCALLGSPCAECGTPADDHGACPRCSSVPSAPAAGTQPAETGVESPAPGGPGPAVFSGRETLNGPISILYPDVARAVVPPDVTIETYRAADLPDSVSITLPLQGNPFAEAAAALRTASPAQPAGETQASINEWQRVTFGAKARPVATAARIVEEGVELLQAVIAGRPVDEIADEVADQHIFGCYLGLTLGFDVQEAINRKMAANRKRMWKADGTGHYQHVEVPK